MYNGFLRKIKVAWDNHAFSQWSPNALAGNRSIWHFSSCCTYQVLCLAWKCSIMEKMSHRVILYSPVTEHPLLSLSLGVIWAPMLAMKLLVLWTVVCPQLGFLQKQLRKTTQNLPQSSQVRKTNCFSWKSVEKQWSKISWTRGFFIGQWGVLSVKVSLRVSFEINHTQSPHSLVVWELAKSKTLVKA